MFFQWFDAKAAKALGEELAALIEHRSESGSSKVNSKQLDKANKHHQITLNLVEKRLQAFTRANRLNIYTKAQLGSAFKYALLDRGYDPDFCSNTTTWLLLRCK